MWSRNRTHHLSSALIYCSPEPIPTLWPYWLESPRDQRKRSDQQDLHPDPLLNDGDHDSIFAISAIIAWNATEWIIPQHLRWAVNTGRAVGWTLVLKVGGAYKTFARQDITGDLTHSRNSFFFFSYCWNTGEGFCKNNMNTRTQALDHRLHYNHFWCLSQRRVCVCESRNFLTGGRVWLFNSDGDDLVNHLSGLSCSLFLNAWIR